ncbi:MAG TPA: tetratricopeptide repeat protein [Thermoanaerobaculia bacterium]
MAFFGRSTPPPSRLEELKSVLQKDPGSRQFLALAEELRKDGEFAEAIRALENGLRLHPGYVAAHVALGRVFREIGQIDDALKAFLSALTIDRENLVAIKQAALLYVEKGDPVEAVKKLKLYRGLNPGDKEVTEQIERLDTQLGTTSRLRQASQPAGLPLPQREPSTRPFFTPPLAPNPPEAPFLPPSQTEPFPRVSLEPNGPGPGILEDRDGAARPSGVEADVFLFFEVETERVAQEGALLAPSAPFLEEVELPEEDEDRTVPGAPIPAAARTVEPRGERRKDLVTRTLADLYLAQGLRAEARNAFEILARGETDPERASALRVRARAIAAEEAAEAVAAVATATHAADPRRERLEAYLRRVGRPQDDSGDLSLIVGELVKAGSGIETAIVTETGGVTVVTAGPFGPAEESLAAEMASFWKNLQRESGDVEAGKPSGVSLVAGAGSAVVSGIGDGYALVLRTAAGASMGRVRYEAARAVSRLRPLLA